MLLYGCTGWIPKSEYVPNKGVGLGLYHNGGKVLWMLKVGFLYVVMQEQKTRWKPWDWCALCDFNGEHKMVVSQWEHKHKSSKEIYARKKSSSKLCENY